MISTDLEGRLAAVAYHKVAQNSRNLQFSDADVPVPGAALKLCKILFCEHQ